MSPAAGFHAQLASIMEVLANTAVAEICELVDSGYSVLQLEISRSRKENEVLRRKLRLMELRTARANALRVAATASSTASPHASGRAHHQGNEPRRIRRPQDHPGEVVLSSVCPQAPPSDSGQEPTQVTAAAGESANLVTEVIKVEDDDESPLTGVMGPQPSLYGRTCNSSGEEQGHVCLQPSLSCRSSDWFPLRSQCGLGSQRCVVRCGSLTPCADKAAAAVYFPPGFSAGSLKKTSSSC